MIRITKFFSRNRRSVDEAADDVVEFLPEQIEPAAEIMETSALLAPRHSARAKRPALGFTSSGSSLLQNSQPGFRRNRAYRHAFTPSHPVAELRRLAGRTELLHRVIRSIEDQELHVVLYGDRGIGKTSVLRVVQGLAEEANYLVHYVSCGPSASFTEVFRSLAAKIPLLYDKTIDPTSGEAVGGQTLASRLPEGDYSVSQLTDVLSGIEGVRVLLILDEFDRADVDLFRHSVGELIKNLSDRLIQLRLLIGGVAGNVTDLVSQIPSIRRNIVGIGVPILTDDEIIDMIGIAESYGNVRFDASARQRLVAVSGGLPYLVGLLGQHAILLAIAADDAMINAGHIDRAVTIGSEDIESRLSGRCTHAIAAKLKSPEAELLKKAATEAIREGGLVIDPAVTSQLNQKADRVADLLVPIQDDPREAWRFAEDGAASLIWLRT